MSLEISIIKLYFHYFEYILIAIRNYAYLVQQLILSHRSHCPITHFYAAKQKTPSDRAFLCSRPRRPSSLSPLRHVNTSPTVSKNRQPPALNPQRGRFRQILFGRSSRKATPPPARRRPLQSETVSRRLIDGPGDGRGLSSCQPCGAADRPPPDGPPPLPLP